MKTTEVSEEEFMQFKRAKEHKFPNMFPPPSILSFERLNLTNLDHNTYIYIADHYRELKKKFGGK